MLLRMRKSDYLTYVRQAMAALVLIVAAFPLSAQDPVPAGSDRQPAPINLPHMYEHAFRAQSGMEKLAANRQTNGGSSSEFRNYLQIKFKLTDDQFDLFRTSALRFDGADQDTKARITE
jgi:hypothetical protein